MTKVRHKTVQTQSKASVAAPHLAIPTILIHQVSATAIHQAHARTANQARGIAAQLAQAPAVRPVTKYEEYHHIPQSAQQPKSLPTGTVIHTYGSVSILFEDVLEPIQLHSHPSESINSPREAMLTPQFAAGHFAQLGQLQRHQEPFCMLLAQPAPHKATSARVSDPR